MNTRLCTALCAISLLCAGCAGAPASSQTSDASTSNAAVSINDAASSKGSQTDEWSVMEAEIVELDGNYCIIEPVEGSWELSSSDKISIPADEIEGSRDPQIGDKVIVKYDGCILESYPAQLGNTQSISLVE